MTSDEALMLEFQGGSRAAFEELFAQPGASGIAGRDYNFAKRRAYFGVRETEKRAGERAVPLLGASRRLFER